MTAGRGKPDGKLFVVSAPSGAGKSTLCRNLIETRPEIEYSVSYTTRQPRAGEVDGQSYNFVSREDFKKMIAENRFLEWASLFGNYYGTGRQWVTDRLDRGVSLVADIDVLGARAIKENFPSAVLIFVVPPTLDELVCRLKKRATESGVEMERRLARVAAEISQRYLYDFLVINDDLNAAVIDLENIFTKGQGRPMADMEAFWQKFFENHRNLNWVPDAYQSRPLFTQTN